MSNLPTREALNNSTVPVYPEGPLPRENRVTGTVPGPAVGSAPVQKAETGGIFGLSASTTFWLLLLVHAGLITAEVYMAYKAGWLGK